jgi:hypothetical protein
LAGRRASVSEDNILGQRRVNKATLMQDRAPETNSLNDARPHRLRVCETQSLVVSMSDKLAQRHVNRNAPGPTSAESSSPLE